MSSSSTSAEHDEDLPRGPISSKRFFFSPHATKSIMEEAKPELGTRKVLALGNTLSMNDAFYDESIAMTMSSEDPYQDFRASMEEMVVAHEPKEWDSLQELPNWGGRRRRRLYSGINSPHTAIDLYQKRGKMSTSATQKRSSSGSFLGLGCGCKDSKSVSVSVSSSSVDAKSVTPAPLTRRARELSSADTMTLSSPSTFSYGEEEVKMESSASTPSLFGLLRQLNELEQDVTSWGRCTLPPPAHIKEGEKKRLHQRSGSEGGGRKVEESVAVVKETKDPLGEFRRSMLQMIIDKEIVDGEELRELLRRFLALNSPRHHDTILRAFAEIWEEVFAGYETTPDLLHHRNRTRLPVPRHF
ncbi:hypothetical protein C4D60_Mb04t24220 [Musa balbisiana]|uniref:Transcription repressor n=1 Tax=Musa balbisiana TaxID=52838 RepID=A0A4S8KEE9_MUSBA|nr:hypothetical protein C4D60_Mb04t24220 [Musa balbisiana]